MNRGLRIAHLCSAKTWRGGEQQLAYLYEGLQEAGHTQWIICRKNSALETHALQKQWQVDSHFWPLAQSLLFAFRLASFCRKNKIDYLHLHDAKAHSAAVLSASLFGNPARMILHRKVDFPVKKNLFSRFKYRHNSIAAALCVSSAVARILQPALSTRALLRVIPDGTDLTRFSQSKSRRFREEYAIPDDTLIIGNVAAITQQKDYFTFVETACLLIESGFPARYLIIGEGNQEDLIRALISAQSLEEHFVFTGFRQDLPSTFTGLDYLLFTSETEGLGSTILDAFSCGVPVVTTNAGGIPEVAHHLKNAWVSGVKDPRGLADGILSLEKNPELKASLVQQAREDVKAYSKEKLSQRVQEVYHELGS